MEKRESKYARNKQHNTEDRMQWFIFMSYTYTQRRADTAHWDRDKTRQAWPSTVSDRPVQLKDTIRAWISCSMCWTRPHAGHAHIILHLQWKCC